MLLNIKSTIGDMFCKQRSIYVIGQFRNGKLHGIVQMYGKMTVDLNAHCSSSIVDGLTFLGWFEDGKPTGKVIFS